VNKRKGNLAAEGKLILKLVWRD